MPYINLEIDQYRIIINIPGRDDVNIIGPLIGNITLGRMQFYNLYACLKMVDEIIQKTSR